MKRMEYGFVIHEELSGTRKFASPPLITTACAKAKGSNLHS